MDNEADPQQTIPPRLGMTRRGRGSAEVLRRQLVAGMPRPLATWAVVGLNVAVFVVMVVCGVSPIDPSIEDLLTWGADFGPLTMIEAPWRIVTSGFVHIGIVHLALNLWCLWSAGSMLERLVGHGAFVLVYVSSLCLASLVSIAWNPSVVSAGASGAVFGVFGGLLVCFRMLRRTVPARVLGEHRFEIGLFVAYNVIYGFASPGIDNAAHIGGLIAGAASVAVLCRVRSDDELRVPVLRLDPRLVPLMVALIAVGWIGAARRVDSHDVWADYLAYRAHASAMAGEHSQALDDLDKLLSQHRESASRASVVEWLSLRAMVMLQLERWPEAEAAAASAIALDASHAWAHYYRSSALSEANRFDAAAVEAETAIELGLDTPDLHHQLLFCLSASDRASDFLDAARRAVRRHEDHAVLHAFLGVALDLRDQPENALEAVERALQLDPTDGWSQQLRADLLGRVKQNR